MIDAGVQLDGVRFWGQIRIEAEDAFIPGQRFKKGFLDLAQQGGIQAVGFDVPLFKQNLAKSPRRVALFMEHQGIPAVGLGDHLGIEENLTDLAVVDLQ